MNSCEIIILGCGGSGGVPLATGYWGNCNPDNPRNRRTRASIAVRTEHTCVVIDTGPDFHGQTISQKISNVDAVIYTHDHADHVNGIDDLRFVAIKKRIEGDEGYKLPVFCNQVTFNTIEQRFHYMFKTSSDGLYVPLLDVNVIADNAKVTFDDLELQCFSQVHGMGKSLGFIIGDVAYSTDVSDFNKNSLKQLQGIKTWIIDCGQFGSEFTTVHPNYQMVLEWNKIVGAEKLYLTHLTPRDDYDAINAATEDYIEAAYDGLIIKSSI